MDSPVQHLAQWHKQIWYGVHFSLHGLVYMCSLWKAFLIHVVCRECWQQLLGLMDNRKQQLQAAGEIHRFNRNVAEALSRIQEKDAALPDDLGRDLNSVLALIRRHEGFENDLVALEAQLQVGWWFTVECCIFIVCCSVVLNMSRVTGAGGGCCTSGGAVPRAECSTDCAAAGHCSVQLEGTSAACSKPQGEVTCELWAADIPHTGDTVLTHSVM